MQFIFLCDFCALNGIFKSISIYFVDSSLFRRDSSLFRRLQSIPSTPIYFVAIMSSKQRVTRFFSLSAPPLNFLGSHEKLSHRRVSSIPFAKSLIKYMPNRPMQSIDIYTTMLDGFASLLPSLLGFPPASRVLSRHQITTIRVISHFYMRHTNEKIVTRTSIQRRTVIESNEGKMTVRLITKRRVHDETDQTTSNKARFIIQRYLRVRALLCVYNRTIELAKVSQSL